MMQRTGHALHALPPHVLLQGRQLHVLQVVLLLHELLPLLGC